MKRKKPNPRENKGNDAWKALGKKDRPFGPKIRLYLTRNDVERQNGNSFTERGA